MYSGKMTLRDYDFQALNKNLTYQAKASAKQSYEIYHYPGRYKDGYGKTLAQIRLQEMTTFKEMADQTSCVLKTKKDLKKSTYTQKKI
jgi:uncharacterized protein involved in type VI secretion and phage assembly